MKAPPKLKRTQERHFSAHHMLIEVARVANERAVKQEPGWFYDALTTMTFSALAVEALCNSIGERKVEDWEDYESSSPNAKLRLLAGRLSINYKKSEEPWFTARWLIKFRNRIAHAKPEFIKEERLLTQEELDKRLFDRPDSKLEREITIANAARALEATTSLKNILCAAISPTEALGLFTDGWSGNTEIARDA